MDESDQQIENTVTYEACISHQEKKQFMWNTLFRQEARNVKHCCMFGIEDQANSNTYVNPHNIKF